MPLPHEVPQFWQYGQEQELRDEVTGYLIYVLHQGIEARHPDDIVSQVKSIANKLASILGDADTSFDFYEDEVSMGFFAFLADLDVSDIEAVMKLLIHEVVRTKFSDYPENEALMARVREIEA